MISRRTWCLLRQICFGGLSAERADGSGAIGPAASGGIGDKYAVAAGFQQQESQPQLLPPQPQLPQLLLQQPQPLLEPTPHPPQQQQIRMMMRMIQQQLPLLPNIKNNTSLYSLEH